MDEKMNKTEYTNYNPCFGRGMRDGNPSITFLGDAVKIEQGTSKAGDTLVHLTLEGYMRDKNLQYWLKDATPNPDHSVRVRVTISGQRADGFLKYKLRYGQKVLVDFKPELKTFTRRDGSSDWSIEGFASNFAVDPEDVAYYKRVEGSNPPVYERIMRKELTPYTVGGGAADAAPAPKAAPAAAPATAPAAAAPAKGGYAPPKGAMMFDEIDDDDELPF